MSLNPQTTQVLNLIQRDGSITRLTAMHYGIANLTARIADLRNAGYKVACHKQKDATGRLYGKWRVLPMSPEVGMRIRIVNKASNEGVYSNGAEGTIWELVSARYPKHPILVQFDRGTYNSESGIGQPGRWYVRAGDYELLPRAAGA